MKPPHASFSPADLIRLHGKALRHIEARIDTGEATAADLAVLARLLSEMNVLALMAVPKQAERAPVTAQEKAQILPFGRTEVVDYRN